MHFIWNINLMMCMAGKINYVFIHIDKRYLSSNPTKYQTQWCLTFQKIQKLSCVSVILRACGMEAIHLILYIKSLGK